MVLYAGLTTAYTKAIYIDGTKKFSEIRSEYVEPVKQFAATNYSQQQIDSALEKGFITQQEYDDTLTYKIW